MSRLVRLLPIATGRRTYSFFSSKPGGGRYFNSTKPPKVVPPTGASTKGSTDPPASTSEVSERKEDGAPSSQCGTGTADDTSFHPSPIYLTPLVPHPMLKPHELKLHHFFSLHRPLLLLNQPTSTLFESPVTTSPTPLVSDGIDNPPEASPEADAEAARQLSRALVINRVGSAVDWEGALQRLGYDMKEERMAENLSLSSSLNVLMDSVKRKRKKKMKKHKLKKRRRLQRASKVKMGK